MKALGAVSTEEKVLRDWFVNSTQVNRKRPVDMASRPRPSLAPTSVQSVDVQNLNGVGIYYISQFQAEVQYTGIGSGLKFVI